MAVEFSDRLALFRGVWHPLNTPLEFTDLLVIILLHNPKGIQPGKSQDVLIWKRIT